MRGIIMFFIVILISFPYLTYGKAHKNKSACTSDEVYNCLHVKRGQSWESLFPDETERDIVIRVNHTNQGLYPGRVIRVPNNLAYSDLLDYSPLQNLIDAPEEKLIIVDLNKHAWGAYDPSGSLVRWGPATGGSDWCRDIGRSCRTKAGTFRIYSLGSAGCKSTKFPVPNGGAPMPYCMFFNGGQALHGSPGQVVAANVSHGCVRLFVQDAEWIRYEFADRPNAENKYRGTKVIVIPY